MIEIESEAIKSDQFLTIISRMIAILATMCILPVLLAAPATRSVDNTIETLTKAQKFMPHEIKKSFPSLMEITKRLTKIYAAGQQMKLTADVFDGAEDIEMINLSDGDLKEIEPRAFYGAKMLRKLDLSGNQLTYLPRDVFPQGNQVKELDVSNNQISRLFRSTFKNLRSLKKLDLSNNKIKELNAAVFADLENLEEIDLSGNPIENISEEFFAGLPSGLQLSFDDHHLDLKSLSLTDQWAL